jgi:Mrp family chromosome partitioning ATPase
MAHVFSLTNKKVLIIDTNFKNNSLTKALLPQIDASRLLSRNNRLLEEKTGALSATEDKVNGHEIIYDTEVKGVSIMGNIGGSESPVEVLSGKDFEGLIERLRDKYDYIFLEGPSLNDHSDSKELVEYVDKVIAVFSAESTLNNLDMASIKYLRSIKAKLAGAVLNRVDLRDVAS